MWVPQENTTSITQCGKKTQYKKGCQTQLKKTQIHHKFESYNRICGCEGGKRIEITSCKNWTQYLTRQSRSTMKERKKGRGNKTTKGVKRHRTLKGGTANEGNRKIERRGNTCTRIERV